MADIMLVQVGNQFESVLTKVRLEVVKIWFEFSVGDQRWETSVTWEVMSATGDNYQTSDKARNFVQMLSTEGFERVKDPEKGSIGITAKIPTSPPSPPSPNGTSATVTTDPKRKQWEDDFRRNASRYGMMPTDLGRKVRLGNRRNANYTIIGAKPRNYKMPILVRGIRGGVYKITVEKAKAGLV